MDKDFHTISWSYWKKGVGPDQKGNLHYYSKDIGWSNNKTGHCEITQPAPDLEVIYQSTFKK
jgi:hypothetical protein